MTGVLDGLVTPKPPPNYGDRQRAEAHHRRHIIISSTGIGLRDTFSPGPSGAFFYSLCIGGHRTGGRSPR